MNRLWRLLLCGLLCGCAVFVDGDDLYGPVLGWICDSHPGALRPLRGIPGAATIGDPVNLGAGIDEIVVAPRRSVAFGITSLGTRQFTLAPDGTVTSADLALAPGFRPTIAAFSPAGSTAVFYSPTTNELWLTRGSPRRLDLSQLPAPIELLAVSEIDDHPLAATLRGDPQTVIVLDSSGGYRQVSGFTRVTGLTFLGVTADLAVADAGAKQVVLLSGPDYAAPRSALLQLPGVPDVPFQVASSADGALLALLAAATSDPRTLERVPEAATRHPLNPRIPTLGLLRLSDRHWTPVDCACLAAGLTPLNGNAVFRLTDRLDRPLWILDGDSPAPGAFFVPAVPQ